MSSAPLFAAPRITALAFLTLVGCGASLCTGEERKQFSVQHVTVIKRQPHAETHRLGAQIGQRLPRSHIHCSDWVGLRRKLWLGAAIAGPASRGGGRILPWPRADVVVVAGEACGVKTVTANSNQPPKVDITLSLSPTLQLNLLPLRDSK